MLDRERGEMGVGDAWPRGVPVAHHFGEDTCPIVFGHA
jgi:hypothetical protein